MSLTSWIQAARLRTLPLAVSTMVLGHSLAYASGAFRWSIAILSVLTAVCLQVLSNYANDYGDSIHGADHQDRQGPQRAVQSGAISLSQMKTAVNSFAILSLIVGLTLVYVAFDDWLLRGGFGILGILAIWAAINYTAGSNPYGYSGKGDIAVFIFFGLVTVIGSYFLQTGSWSWDLLLPAIACGALSAGVLNVNNIRDIDSDKIAGKRSIPVKIGRSAAVGYHGFLLSIALIAFISYGVLHSFGVSFKWLFLILTPLLLINFLAVKNKKEATQLDPYLKQLALTTAGMIVLFSIGLVVM